MKEGDKAWAFWANTFGPAYKRPQRVVFDGDSLWWYKNGDYSIKTLGLYRHGGYISFASENKKEVELFIEGFMASRSIMAIFCTDK